eukprot:gnl/TRDRNA2_/TRDRNA2_140960_c0_seq3.p1 gnl/TRDRNA2_/TRDRNA2_140960_c0~~gnl/TRDRNA2_/TRDRNA2_140960_c0_seq3.p1  ORF type:complete len:474 (-),score=51.85 gnl/TRDRNA2_/TRDRNA2_140960_c0_seq3:70-1491(-)
MMIACRLLLSCLSPVAGPALTLNCLASAPSVHSQGIHPPPESFDGVIFLQLKVGSPTLVQHTASAVYETPAQIIGAKRDDGHSHIIDANRYVDHLYHYRDDFDERSGAHQRVKSAEEQSLNGHSPVLATEPLSVAQQQGSSPVLGPGHPLEQQPMTAARQVKAGNPGGSGKGKGSGKGIGAGSPFQDFWPPAPSPYRDPPAWPSMPPPAEATSQAAEETETSAAQNKPHELAQSPTPNRTPSDNSIIAYQDFAVNKSAETTNSTKITVVGFDQHTARLDQQPKEWELANTPPQGTNSAQATNAFAEAGARVTDFKQDAAQVPAYTPSQVLQSYPSQSYGGYSPVPPGRGLSQTFAWSSGDPRNDNSAHATSDQRSRRASSRPNEPEEIEQKLPDNLPNWLRGAFGPARIILRALQKVILDEDLWRSPRNIAVYLIDILASAMGLQSMTFAVMAFMGLLGIGFVGLLNYVASFA